MSVTVEDTLHLSSLRNAKVIGGRGGLGRIVSGISVLECADPEKLISDLFQSGDYLASELVITGFLNNTTNIDLQCKIIQRLWEGGEAGLILFYVGTYMPAVDRRLIDLADQLDFVLIQMPANKGLRYGAIISDVSECLFRDRERNVSIVSEILDQVTGLAEHHRTVNVVLKILSERLQMTVILSDMSFNILNLASWPGGMEEELKQHTNILRRAANSESVIPCPFIPNSSIYHTLICPASTPSMHLFLIKEGQDLSALQQEQSADLVRIGVNIWGRQHNSIVLSELIRAIIQDDPFKMRRLADIFQIDIREIHDMWVLYGSGDTYMEILRRYQSGLQEALGSCAGNVFSDFYDERLFLFSSDPYSLRTAVSSLTEILEEMAGRDGSITMFYSGGLQDTSEVREAYLCYKTHLQDVKKLYPGRFWFSYGQLEFAQQCHRLVDRGEEAVHDIISRLRAFQDNNTDWDILTTLEVFLLDAECSVSRSSEILHVHPNTIKYRIKVIENILGYRPGKMPDTIQLYNALAVHRLITS